MVGVYGECFDGGVVDFFSRKKNSGKKFIRRSVVHRSRRVRVHKLLQYRMVWWLMNA